MADRRHAPLFIPTVPIELNVSGPADYFAIARQNRDVGKASIDLIFLEIDGDRGYDA